MQVLRRISELKPDPARKQIKIFRWKRVNLTAAIRVSDGGDEPVK